MKAAVVIMHSDKYGDHGHELCDGLSLPVNISGATREEYEYLDSRFPQSVVMYKNKAVLDAAGEPCIHSWVEVAYDPTFEEWCKTGYDHEQKVIRKIKYGDTVIDEYIYIRKVIKYRWVVEISTLEEFLHLVENLGAEYEYTPDYPYTPGIAHNFIFEVEES